MKRAALYLRRSTEEHQVESLETQRESANVFAAKLGAEVIVEFIDDAISRAEFKKRPGLLALLVAGKRGDFDTLITRDETRLGGDTFRTGVVIQDLLDAGVALHYYATGERVSFDDPTSKIVVAVRNFASELERVKTSQRTYEHLQQKAKKGRHTGGRVFGYDNIKGENGTDYAINKDQAAVVVWMFERYADGWGLREIAKDLNERGITSPRGKFWKVAAIWEILRRERYRGEYTWGKTEKAYRGGTKVRIQRAASELTKAGLPELRIVSEELWAAVQERITKNKRENLGKRAREGAPPKYLLSGLARCGVCGGPMKVGNGKSNQRAIKVYGCANHRDGGDRVCSNKLRRPVEDLDSAVLTWIQTEVLQERLVVRTLKTIRTRLAERVATVSTEAPALEAQTKKLRAELDKLGEALLASSEKSETIVRMIDEREGRLRTVQARLASMKSAPDVLDMETRRMEREARKWIADLKAVLGATPEETKQALTALLGGEKLTLMPRDHERRYEIRGRISTGVMFTNLSVPSGI